MKTRVLFVGLVFAAFALLVGGSPVAGGAPFASIPDCRERWLEWAEKRDDAMGWQMLTAIEMAKLRVGIAESERDAALAELDRVEGEFGDALAERAAAETRLINCLWP